MFIAFNPTIPILLISPKNNRAIAQNRGCKIIRHDALQQTQERKKENRKRERKTEKYRNAKIETSCGRETRAICIKLGFRGQPISLHEDSLWSQMQPHWREGSPWWDCREQSWALKWARGGDPAGCCPQP